MKEDVRPKTIFIDIDGTMLKHPGKDVTILSDFDFDPEILPGVKEKIQEWDAKGYNIIVTTGRRESIRKQTEAQLSKAGILYDQLIMGICGGKRYLINDFKPDSTEPYAIAINVDRNKGLGNIEI